jgi:hypothetical protein
MKFHNHVVDASDIGAVIATVFLLPEQCSLAFC